MERVRGRSWEGAKRPTNLSISEELLAEAKELEVNLSRAAETGIAQAVREKRARMWLEENRDALDSSNAYVEKHGLPLSRYRAF